MEMSESLFVASAFEQGRVDIGERSLGRRRAVRNGAWSDYCQSLLLPTKITRSDLKIFAEKQTSIERIYSASLVYALAQTKLRRKTLAMYFTPPSLSEYVLDRVESFGADFVEHRFIDPAAGGASFVGPIALRMIERGATSSFITEALHGVEIDPALAEFARAAAHSVIGRPVDHMITCGDGLVQGQSGKFDAVIGNPPYRVLTPAQRKRMPVWAKPVLGNYANLYSLFILRGLQLLRENGLLAFLVPTSFITGNYFGKLRQHISEVSTILSIDIIEQRKEFFRDVSQDVCLLVCRKSTQRAKSYTAVARLVDKDMRSRSMPAYAIEVSSNKPWLRTTGGRPRATPETLESLGYTVRCGPIVHNRDDGLSEGIRRRRKCAVPLVWGHVIRPLLAVEPASRSSKPGTGRITFVSTARQTPPETKPSIVLQRTNSGDQDRRIRAGFVDSNWLKKYGGFYGENHVVVISPDATKQQRCSLYTLLRIISTRSVDRRLRPLLSSNSINVTALRELKLPKLSEHKFRLIEGCSDKELESIVEKAYG